MIIVCQQCKTQFHLDDNTVRQKQFLARCSRCGYVFQAYKQNSAAKIPFLDLKLAKSTDCPKIIAVSNQKGGVAKTSSCLNIGASLAMDGKRVLLVDFDIQANLSISLGLRDKVSFYDTLKRGAKLTDLILKTRYSNLWLIPSSKAMILLNKKYFNADNFEFILKDRLIQVQDQYDYILIDTPPSIDLFTINALTAAHTVVIPCQCDYLSTHGVDQILKMIDMIKLKTNPRIEAKVLVTMFDDSSASSKVIRQKITDMYKERAFKTIIDNDAKMKEAQILSMPVMHYDKRSRAGVQYLALSRELLEEVEARWANVAL